MKKYWFISYAATHGNRQVLQHANDAIDISPAEWIKETYEEEYYDGPYVILYAEEISEELYKWYKDHA